MPTKINYFAAPGTLLKQKPMVKLDKIVQLTSTFFNLTIEQLTGKNRKREYVLARQFMFYVGKKNYNFILNDLGAAAGGRDHTTAIHGIRTIEDLVETDNNIANTLQSYRVYISLNL